VGGAYETSRSFRSMAGGQYSALLKGRANGTQTRLVVIGWESEIIDSMRL